MTEKRTACNVPMYKVDLWQTGIPCGRLANDDEGMCICHSEDESKDVVLFQEEIDKIFADNHAELFNFTRFIFPKRGWSFKQKQFEKDASFFQTKFSGWANFNQAQFSGAANFEQAQFSGAAIFWSAQFSGSAEFREALFSGNAEFRKAQFSGNADFSMVMFSGEANFAYVQFSGEANFGAVQFSGKVNLRLGLFPGGTFIDSGIFHGVTSFNGSIAESGAHITFDGEKLYKNQMWKNSADFTSLIIKKDAIVTFRKISMEGVQLLEANIIQMEFIDVDWSRTGRWHKRRTVADEIVEGEKDYSLIAQVYQGLQENYASTYRYLEAGDFFVGEQEMRRKGKGKWRQYFSLNNAYRILSYYGQNIPLPLLWLLGAITIVPGLLLYGGVRLNLQDKSVMVNYDWSFDISDFLILNADYWQTFLLNFSFMAFSRSKMHDALTEPWQIALVNFEALVVIGLVAMSLLAVRRRFKRKNF